MYSIGMQTRWMAPELILALVEDDEHSPPITTASDVYSFACVCLEVISTSYLGFGDSHYLKIATGQVPYNHRKNDHAVVVDIMRGIRPSRGASCRIQCHDEGIFWEMLEKCWNSAVSLRPSMSEVAAFLSGQTGPPAVSLTYKSTRPASKY
jgi:serine/threonine protein kinase